MKTTPRVFGWLAGAAVAALLGASVSFWTFTQIEQSAALQGHTLETLNHADELLASMIDAESSMRGYMLTGDEAFLEPYLAVRDGVPGALAALRRMTTLGAAEAHLEALTPLVDARLAHLSRAIELRRSGDVAGAVALVRSGQGRLVMSSIRAELRSFVDLEEGARALHDAKFRSSMRRLFILMAVVSSLTLLFALSFAYWIVREAQQRLKNLVHAETLHLLTVQGETNRKLERANLTLLESEGRLAVTLNSIGDAVIATDADARVTLMNPVAEKLTGWTQAEAAGRSVEEIVRIISQETRLPSVVPVKEALAHGTVQGLAHHSVLIMREGGERPIADSCAPIRDGDGDVSGAVLVFRDITEENQAQQALRDNAALIQTVLNTVGDGIITLRARGGIVEKVNRAAEQMFGRAAAEFVGQGISMLIPELDQDQRNGSLEYYAASDAARAAGLGREVVGRRADGSSFPLEMTVSEMWLGEQRYFTGILRDITARKEVEAEQKQLAQRLRDHQFYTRSLFESNVDALTTTDPSGIITDVNKQMEALTGCSRDELIGAPLRSHFTDPERAEAAVKLVLSERKLNDYELTAHSKDGKETVVSLNATTLYDRDRRLQGVFAAARDVTERKRLDQVLQEKNVELVSAKHLAEKANLAKSDFLSSMSHELRSPLNAILGFAQLMESDAPPPTPAQKESIDQILRAGWHLLTLINEILDLAKVESRQIPLSQEPVSLAEVLRECQGMMEPQAQKRGVEMTFPQFEKPSFVLADQTRVKQVIVNLLSNAIKYNVANGKVEVSCGSPTPERTRVSIRDTGTGLSPEHVAQLFQPFNRLGQEAGGEEGTGIGLVVAKRLVELMGGTVGVESVLGVGSVFWIELASVAEPALSHDPGDVLPMVPLREARGARHRTLLYVEDNPANLRLVEQIIARHPSLRLLSAVNGDSGVEIARASRPDVILMDINLPGINGYEVLKILRAEPSTAHIPVIAISANAMAPDLAKGLKAGFFHYLTKPIKVKEFMESLTEALEFAQDGVKQPT